MSIPVALADLDEVMGRFGPAYLVTVDDEGRPRILAVTPRWVDGAVVVAGLGRSTRVNVSARPEVTVLWPPAAADSEHTLIVDGTARLDDDETTAIIAPGAAILHVRRDPPEA